MELDEADSASLLGKAPTAAPSGAAAFKDRPFAVVFLAQLVTVGGVAVVLGLPNISSLFFTMRDESTAPKSQGVTILLILLLTSGMAAGVSVLWLAILRRYAGKVIYWTLRLGIAGLVGAAVLAFSGAGVGGRAGGFMMLFTAMWLLCFYSSVRRRIPFAAANLEAATRILGKFPSLATTACVALLVQGVWTLVWGLALMGLLAKTVAKNQDSSSVGNACFFLMALAHFWFADVVKNVIHCICAGTVGEWWFGLHNASSVHRARLRALTTSLGSICLGSFLIAILSGVRLLLITAPQRKRGRSVNACLECIVQFALKNVQYFNRFAFCHVAIYGKDFRSAGTDTMQLFRQRGWSTILSDTFISSVLAVGCVVVGAITGAIGSVWTYLALKCEPNEMDIRPAECQTFNMVVMAFVACAAIGFAMCAIVSSVLESIVATIFVCFAEDPAALKQSHPEEHAKLVNAWRHFKPDLLSVSLAPV